MVYTIVFCVLILLTKMALLSASIAVETGLTLLAHASLPIHFWEDAFFNVVFLINRLLTTALAGDIPLTRLYNKLPDYSALRVFGCLCFPCLRPHNHHKIEY